MNLDNSVIAVIGLGYVGLPLAVEFGKRRTVIGFDINPSRILALQAGKDSTLELSPEQLQSAKHLKFTTEPQALLACSLFIVTVPTPVDKANRPNMAPLAGACETVGAAMNTGAVVIFESTVYPGATEEFCVPLLERHSGLKFNRDFFCGYSPERVNPGDKLYRLPSIKKVTSGSTAEVALILAVGHEQFKALGAHSIKALATEHWPQWLSKFFPDSWGWYIGVRAQK